MLDVFFGIAELVYGWRSALGLVSGAAIDGALVFLHAPKLSDGPALAGIMILCYLGGLYLDLVGRYRRANPYH